MLSNCLCFFSTTTNVQLCSPEWQLQNVMLFLTVTVDLAFVKGIGLDETKKKGPKPQPCSEPVKPVLVLVLVSMTWQQGDVFWG